jgi:transposase-like protein
VSTSNKTLDLNPKSASTFYGKLAVIYLEVVMPKFYSAEFRREACERLLAGEAVLDLAKEFEIGYSTLYRWKRQALVEIGQAPGTKRVEAEALAKARRRINELEDELTLVKAASKLFEELSHDPKASTRW